jgi:hypothetical protein
MTLHQALADLARDHGTDLFRDAAAFRGSLDDYLDEGQASSGTINLLTDAVRLGALDGMVTMLDSGANPSDAVESAGQRLARDRGSADVRGCQWALAVLGYALGKVPESLVSGLDPDAGTAAPPSYGPGGTAPAQPVPPPPAPMTSPMTSPMAPPTGQQPIMSPPHQPMVSPPHPAQAGGAGYGAPTYAGGGWSQQPPPPKKSKTGLIVGAIVLALVVIVGGIIGIVALSGNGSDKKADDTKTEKTTDAPTTDSTEGTDTPTESGTDVPDIGGPTITGLGYTVQIPTGWNDGTADFVKQNPGLTTLDKVFLWGDTFNTARGNVIVETQSSYGSTDPNDLKSNWKTALTQGDSSAEVTDIADTTIGGQTALGVDIARTNDSDVKVSQRSYLVINGDKGYSITVSLREGDNAVLQKFDQILSTWRWSE